MKNSQLPLLRGAIWTFGGFGISQLLRLVTNIVLARLLAPELFGIMQIVYSMQTGVELISDVGLGQNIVYNKNANDPDFYNTVWTIQLIRGVLLWIVICAIAVPTAKFYQSPTLVLIMPVVSFSAVLGGFSSTSRFLLQKRMKYSTLTTFDTIVAIVFSAIQLLLAYFIPTIWALVFGTVAGTMAYSIGSHFILPDARHKFFVSRKYTKEILSFGKWIFVSSIVYFLSTNFDRLYLAKLIPLELLGVYGIARTLSGMVSSAVLQLASNVIFPFIASHSHTPRTELHALLAPTRLKFLVLIGFGLSILAAIGDMAIKILYDQRYQAASWMLPILIIGAWFSILSNLNESSLMGLGKPNYSALGNGAKFGFLFIGLVFGFGWYGVPGGVIAVAISDLGRYVPIFVGQTRERFSYGRQDILVTLAVFGLTVFWEWLRWTFGFGTSFDTFPISIAPLFGTVR
jgi:O-antigen/teichoic acid export membrane protein